MKYNKTLALVPALLLAACGGDEETMNETINSRLGGLFLPGGWPEQMSARRPTWCCASAMR